MSGLDFELSGKLAVVTGGANGIGFAAAELLAANGASVAIFDLERESPQNVAKQIGARGFVADVTDRESLDAAFAAAGTPDIVALFQSGCAARLLSAHSSWARRRTSGGGSGVCFPGVQARVLHYGSHALH